MNIGQKITHYRTAKHYSVNKLANLAGISQSYLRDIELGNKNPTVEVVSLICDALDLTLSDFFSDSSEKKLLEDPLMTKIYALTPSQKDALLTFLNTLTNE